MKIWPLVLTFLGGLATGQFASGETVRGSDDNPLYYNDFSGETSDGNAIVGVAWFRPGAETGTFCLRAGQAVCMGHFPANKDLSVTGKFQCTDGNIGVFAVTRTPMGNFVLPQKASAMLSDGRTGAILFGPLQSGNVAIDCHDDFDDLDNGIV